MSDIKQIPIGKSCKTATGYERVIASKEVEQHNKEDDCWMIIHGKVYDVTAFLVDHPGGPDILINEAGTDATAKFEETFHSDDARKQLADYTVGTVEGFTGANDELFKHGPSAAKRASSTSTSTSQASATSPLVYVAALAVVGALAYFVL